MRTSPTHSSYQSSAEPRFRHLAYADHHDHHNAGPAPSVTGTGGAAAPLSTTDLPQARFTKPLPSFYDDDEDVAGSSNSAAPAAAAAAAAATAAATSSADADAAAVAAGAAAAAAVAAAAGAYAADIATTLLPPLSPLPVRRSRDGRLVDSNRLSIAPMMEVTDRHFRYMMRLLSRRCKLYTEMIVDETLLHNLEPRALEFYLGHSAIEGPLAVQLGGNDPEKLGRAAGVCEAYGGYEEINLNCGCPSPKVSKRCFGARLMLDPERVRRLVDSMTRHAPQSEVTVKCRIGADDRETYEELKGFVDACRAGGARRLIVHARKCLLSGLSASANRNIPPLYYEVVHQLARDFPDMAFSLNGGVMDLQEALSHLSPLSRVAPTPVAPLVDGGSRYGDDHFHDEEKYFVPPPNVQLSGGSSFGGSRREDSKVNDDDDDDDDDGNDGYQPTRRPGKEEEFLDMKVGFVLPLCCTGERRREETRRRTNDMFLLLR
jgi:tRNA dihydrouridine synthase A